jgi:hypothetical protein
MTLQLILWAIPVASLTAAFVLIGFRACLLTRDSLARRALLAEAGNAALQFARPELRVTIPGFRRLLTRNARPRISPPAARRPSNCRLQPVPFILCRPARAKMALAG